MPSLTGTIIRLSENQKRRNAKRDAKLRRQGKLPPPPHVMPSPHLCEGHMKPLGAEGKKFRAFYKSIWG